MAVQAHHLGGGQSRSPPGIKRWGSSAGPPRADPPRGKDRLWGKVGAREGASAEGGRRLSMKPARLHAATPPLNPTPLPMNPAFGAHEPGPDANSALSGVTNSNFKHYNSYNGYNGYGTSGPSAAGLACSSVRSRPRLVRFRPGLATLFSEIGALSSGSGLHRDRPAARLCRRSASRQRCPARGLCTASGSPPPPPARRPATAAIERCQPKGGAGQVGQGRAGRA